MKRRASVLLLAFWLDACHDKRPPPEVELDLRHPGPGAIGIQNPQEEIDAIAKRVAKGEIPKVQFNFDSDKILPDSFQTLDAVVAVILANPRLKVVVTAHTDSVGTETYNLDLSRRRARSVKEYMVKHGVPPPSIRYFGMGYSAPIADNSTEGGREKNRRVEFRVTTREWPAVW